MYNKNKGDLKMKNIKIKVYEDLTNCEMTEEQEDSYLKFCQTELEKMYPEYNIEVLNDQNLNKVVIKGDFEDYMKENELREEIEVTIPWMFEKWDK